MRRASVAIVLAASVGCIVTSDSDYLTARSSDGHQVRLQGNLKTAPWIQYLAYRVLAEPVRAGHSSGDTIELHHALNSSFRAHYPTESWEAANVLRFVSVEWTTQPRQRVLVVNDTSQTLSYALLKWGDAVLILDLPRYGHIGVRVPQGIDLPVLVKGKLADGRILSGHVADRSTAVIRFTDGRIVFDDRRD